MQASGSFSTLLQRIDEYKKRYFVNQLLKGTLLFTALLISAYLLVNTAEFFGRFNTGVRAGLFFGFMTLLLGGLYHYVVRPLLGLYGLRKPLSNEEAARQIGAFFPEVGDKLLNTLQLQQLSTHQSELLQASLNQRSDQLLVTRFANAIQLDKNRRFLKYLIPPLAVVLLILLINPTFFSATSTRLVRYNQEFAERAPFEFQVVNSKLQAFRNEDFTLDVRLTGTALPQTAYLIMDGTRFKLEPTKAGVFSYTFDNVQRPLNFHLEAAGFRSKTYGITLLDRPSVLAFDVTLNYPAYLNKPSEQLANVGNMLVPQGTLVTWKFTADHTDSLRLRFSTDKAAMAARLVDDNLFSLSRRLQQSTAYTVEMQNKAARNASNLEYTIQVIPDRYPQVSVQQLRDTIGYNFVALSGLIADDYGFSRLKLLAKITRSGEKSTTSLSKDIPVNRSTTSQNFYYNWYLDSLNLQPSDQVEYFVQVWDNDGVNGPKSTKTATQVFTVPSPAELQKQIDQSAEKTEQQIDNALSKAQSIKRDLNAIENRIKTKRSSDFQDKKQVQEVLKKREELLQELQKLQEQFRLTNETQQRFAQENKALQEKMEQLQKMFEQLTDPETKRLYDELKQLLEKKQDEKASDLLDRLSRRERNLEKELDRALKLFKQMQLEQKLDNIVQNLEKQAEKQEQLSQQNDKNTDQQQALQEQLNAQKEFQDTKEQLNKLQQEAEKEQLTKPDPQEQTQQEIDQQLQQATQQLQQKQQKQAKSSQSKTAKSMRDMAKSLAESMQSAEMKENQENMDDLRALLENLITLSFEQEKVMKEFRSMNMQDPRVVKLSQQQLKLQEDARIIEDSLNALAKRVVQIQSFVTRELTDMKYYMDESVQQLRERRLSQASARQQFAMTSINNLSLMLNDVFKQMQQAMSAMAMPGMSKPGQKGSKPSPGMSQMQQELNAKMQQLSQSGKSGRGLSEELSRLAAEQAMLRKMLKDIQDANKGTEAGKKLGNQLNELMQKMDETETDLVNKRINQNTLNRQNDIMTRLLESEKALKQQEEDPKRQSTTAKAVERVAPSYLDTLIPQKSKQTEVLRSVTPVYNQYYKTQANQYLQKVTR